MSGPGTSSGKDHSLPGRGRVVNGNPNRTSSTRWDGTEGDLRSEVPRETKDPLIQGDGGRLPVNRVVSRNGVQSNRVDPGFGESERISHRGTFTSTKKGDRVSEKCDPSTPPPPPRLVGVNRIPHCPESFRRLDLEVQSTGLTYKGPWIGLRGPRPAPPHPTQGV